VYADPYPGFVHGVTPAICKHGCEPVLSDSLGETTEQKLWREAFEFVDQYADEMALTDEVRKRCHSFDLQCHECARGPHCTAITCYNPSLRGSAAST
jgi:hypothetical protein